MNINDIVKFIMSLLTSATTASKPSSKSQPSPSLEVKAPVVPRLREDGDFYVWTKGEKFKLTDHFSTAEFACQCSYADCKEQRISKSLIKKVEAIRVEVGQPLVVTSAYRCQKHQAYIRSSGQSTVVAQKLSQHELGKAVDIRPKDALGIRTTFLAICEKQFQAIGLSDRFLHCDLRGPDKIRWEY